MAHDNDIAVQQIIKTIEEMYRDNQIDMTSDFAVSGEFDCEIGNGMSCAMNWLYDGREVLIESIEAYDDNADEEVAFSEADKAEITEAITSLSREYIEDAKYGIEMADTYEYLAA